MMGLYLALFDETGEVDGVEVGAYADFGALRDAVVINLEGRVAGSRFPTLILHSDCDGQWTPADAATLEQELLTIGVELRRFPAVPFNSEWKKQSAKTFGIQPQNLYDCFFDVDGEPLIERLIGLARLSQSRGLPILFQ
jgi:hypothetical protein